VGFRVEYRFLGQKRPFLELVGVGWSFSSTFARRPKQAGFLVEEVPGDISAGFYRPAAAA
jgi:hypothetical protein